MKHKTSKPRSNTIQVLLEVANKYQKGKSIISCQSAKIQKRNLKLGLDKLHKKSKKSFAKI